MSPQLRESLRAAAIEAGCSLNGFAIQVLSAAAGDASRFRSADESEARATAARPTQNWRHRQARNDFMRATSMEIGSPATAALVMRLDVEDPGHYLEWQRAREAESA